MSNKLGLDDIASVPWCENENAYAEIERILRSHGWLHEDDVVEGKEVPGKCGFAPNYSYTCKKGRCIKCPDHIKSRPATVKDLIG